MKQIFILATATILFVACNSNQTEMKEYKLAKSYFAELDSLCSIDNGELWGMNLYGPTMLVNPETRLIIANRQDKSSSFVEHDGVFVGHFPEDMNIANTFIDWQGEPWTMVMWNALSMDDKFARNKLLMHESWHRIQKEIDIQPITTNNTHLDELQGSILLKLEFMALQRGLIVTDSTKIHEHLKNAYILRKFRQTLFPGNNENMFELHEGMPEYTGFKLCGLHDSVASKVVTKQLHLALEKDGLANSFAYLSGPAYGYIFDKLSIKWILKVRQGADLQQIVSSIIQSEDIPSDSSSLKMLVSEIVKTYDAQLFIESETKKFEAQQKLVAEYKQKIMESSHLIIPNSNVNMSYNPQEKLIGVENGVIYKTARLTAEWGILEVRNGIFRSNDWQNFIIPSPKIIDANPIKETDYDLTLNKGWQIVKITEGKFTLKQN